MIRLANVLIVQDDRGAAAIFGARLAHNGYHVVTVSDIDQALSRLASEHLDLVIVGDCGMTAVAAGTELRKSASGRDIPIVAAATAVDARLALSAFEAGLDDVLSWSTPDQELLARLRPLVRLATMRAELDQRSAIALRLGVKAPAQAAASGERPVILLVGDADADLAQMLSGEAEVVVSTNLYEAEGLLERRNFDAAVIRAGGDPEAYLAFSAQVRNNPRLFNLPLVLVVESDATVVEGYRQGASRVFVRPVDETIFRCAVLTLVRRQQLRWAIRLALAESLRAADRDEMTGAYNREFLDRYLAARLATAASHQRHLAVVFFAIPNVDGVRSHFGEDAALHLSQQLAQWIMGLLRAEDLTAYYGHNEFCVILPDTPLVEAEVVMHRIAGVLAYTDFAVREVYQPVKVWVQVGATSARPDDTLDGLVKRARAKLD